MTTRIKFKIDLVPILKEAVSDPRRAKSALRGLCLFWQKNGALYHRPRSSKKEIVESNMLIKEIRAKLSEHNIPKSTSLQVLQEAIQKPRQGKFPRANQAIDVQMGNIRSCLEMAEYSDEFALAVLTEQQATECFESDDDKDCKHCQDVEVISWKYLNASCVIEETKARAAAAKMLDEFARSVPLDATSKQLWEMFFQGYARTASEVTLVDYYVGLDRKYLEQDFENFLVFLDRDFAHNSIPNKTLTIFTTLDPDMVDDFKNVLQNIVRHLRHLEDVRVYPFEDERYLKMNKKPPRGKRFPRDRWLGFNGYRSSLHGIDFLSKARPGDGVDTYLPESKKAEDLKEIERKLRAKEIAISLTPFSL